MTRVLFLDVDGVLNSTATRPNDAGVRTVGLRPLTNPEVVLTGLIDDAKVDMLRDALERHRFKLVLSSSWRKAFRTAGEFATAIGLTPPLQTAPDYFHKDWKTGWRFSSRRCHEIDWWLEDHPEVKRFAVLDDHDCIPPDWRHIASRFVKTDPDVGLTADDLDRALEAMRAT